ncbi:sigma 54-interacting transcriptional regulator [candidate division WOR-3 bacterium]|nr:sigma 54-interacting transcriptional regulator [candidate division WOR-3 bacterium]
MEREEAQATLNKGLTLLRVLGKGEGTVVWLAADEETGKDVAVKMATEPDSTHRLEREFAMLERFDHPGILKVFKFSINNNLPYFTMEFIEGEPFNEFLLKCHGSEDFSTLFTEVFGQVVAILALIHHQGVVHADVKPANLLVRDSGEPVLLDFGFAEDYMLERGRPPRGTLDYVAPELFRGENVGPATDLYSLGVMAYEVLAGKKLWEKESLRDLVASKLTTPPAFGKNLRFLSEELKDLILRLLNPEPELRPTASEVADIVSLELNKTKGLKIASPGFVPRLVFGGREEEIEELERLLFEEKKVVFLTGEQGIGKTRLMCELRFRSLVKKRNIIMLHCRAGHLSLLEHLAAIIGMPRNAFTADEAVQNYERILQELYKQGISALLIDAACELSTYEEQALGFLARGLEAKSGVLLTGVEEEIHPTGSKFLLAPLSDQEIEELVKFSFRTLTSSKELAYDLSALSQGNPHKFQELLEIFCHQGWLRQEPGWVYSSPDDKSAISTQLSQWLEEKTALLHPPSKTLLNVLALSEGSLPLDVLKQINRGSDITWSLKELSRKRLVNQIIHRDRIHYAIPGEFIKEAALAKIQTKEAQRLLKDLVYGFETTLEARWGKDLKGWQDDECLIHLARLSFKAKLTGKAKTYLILAAKQLVNLGYFDQAITFYENLLTLNPGVEKKTKALKELGRIASIRYDPEACHDFYSRVIPLTKDPEEKADLLYRIGMAYQRSRDLDLAGEYFDKSEQYLGEKPSELSTQLLSARGWNALLRSDLDEAERSFDRCLVEKASPANHHRNLFSLAIVLTHKAEYGKALNYVRQALEGSKACKENSAACQYAILAVDICQRLGNLKQAETYLGEAEELSLRIQNPFLNADILRFKATLAGYKGQVRNAKGLARQALEILDRLQSETELPAVLAIGAEQSRNLGEWDHAHETLRKLWKIVATQKSRRNFIPYVLTNWSHLFLEQGKRFIADRMLRKIRNLTKTKGSKADSIGCAIMECRFAFTCNDYPKAREILKGVFSVLDNDGDIWSRLNVALLGAELFYKEGKISQALTESRKLIKKVEESGFEALLGEALRLEGEVLVASDEYKKGLAVLRRSIDVFKKQENLYEYGKTLYIMSASMFEKQGYSDEALTYLEEAKTVFQRLSLEPELARIQRFRAEHFQDWRQPFGLSLAYLSGLKYISELINNRLGEEDFMIQLLSVILELTGAERGMVFFVEKAQLYSVASKQMDASSKKDARLISQTVIRQVKQELAPIYTSDATQDDRFNRAQSIILNRIRSILCLPLKIGDRLIGTVYLDSRMPGLFDQRKVIYFEALSNLLAVTTDKSLEFQKLKEELLLSRRRKKWERSGVVIGNSPVMKEICRQLEQAAQSEANVLLEGETGTGKGVYARMIHEQSTRRDREFCSIDCGILPETLFESELFGAKKGAYSGADQDRMGLLEAADGSTVFLDEITNMTLATQGKLLEVIEERVIRRLGETRKRQVNIRFIFATNRNLVKEVRDGNFREDLYYRLATFKIHIPSLRDRKEDIPEFVDFFVKKYSSELSKEVNQVGSNTIQALMNYYWPGNIRELANVMERAVLLAKSGRISPRHLDQRFWPQVTPRLKDIRRIEDAELIRRTLFQTRGNVTQAAKRLGISRQHLIRLIKRYGISRDPTKG